MLFIQFLNVYQFEINCESILLTYLSFSNNFANIAHMEVKSKFYSEPLVDTNRFMSFISGFLSNRNQSFWLSIGLDKIIHSLRGKSEKPKFWNLRGRDQEKLKVNCRPGFPKCIFCHFGKSFSQ